MSARRGVAEGTPFASARRAVAEGRSVVSPRRAVAAALALALCVAPLGSARAWSGGTDPESRLGVLLMVLCGLAAKAIPVAPVPYAGIAIVSCGFGLLDAALSPDDQSAGNETPVP